MKAVSTAQNVDKRHVGGQHMCRDQRIATDRPGFHEFAATAILCAATGSLHLPRSVAWGYFDCGLESTPENTPSNPC